MRQTERPRNPGPAYGGHLRRLQQSFARRVKENTLPLLTRTVPENALRPVRLRNGDSTLDPIGEKKMPSYNKLQEGGISCVTLQEASEYVVTHCAGCAILFNKDTFCPNVDAKSIHLHDARRDLPSQVIEGEQGGSFKCVLSRASFRRPPTGGWVDFTV